MKNTSNSNDTEKQPSGLGRLMFGMVTGVGVGALVGYLFHRKFPAAGNTLAESIHTVEGIVDPNLAKQGGGYYLSSITAAVGAVAGLFVADKTSDKNR